MGVVLPFEVDYGLEAELGEFGVAGWVCLGAATLFWGALGWAARRAYRLIH